MHKTLSVKSRVRGDFHARFCERVKLPRSTRPMIRIYALSKEELSKVDKELEGIVGDLPRQGYGIKR